jgi:excisionase family DNA binding protein
MPEAQPPEVTIVNGVSWATRPEQLAQILSRTVGGAVIPDPAGQPADPATLMAITDPGFWSGKPGDLRDALRSLALPEVGPASRSEGRSAGVITTGPDRLTLTVEEAAVALGISRASAYEAVRRGDVPSIRIGRRILVPRRALDQMLDVTRTSAPEG